MKLLNKLIFILILTTRISLYAESEYELAYDLMNCKYVNDYNIKMIEFKSILQNIKKLTVVSKYSEEGNVCMSSWSFNKSATTIDCYNDINQESIITCEINFASDWYFNDQIDRKEKKALSEGCYYWILEQAKKVFHHSFSVNNLKVIITTKTIDQELSWNYYILKSNGYDRYISIPDSNIYKGQSKLLVVWENGIPSYK